MKSQLGKIALVVFVAALCGCVHQAGMATTSADPSVRAEDEAAQRWEAPLRDLAECRTLPTTLIVRVSVANRQNAIERLRIDQAVELTFEEAQQLTGAALNAASVGPRHPFLVRAISKNELSSVFLVRQCGSTLRIVNGSLGRSTPPSVRAPLVVFLEDAPARVEVSWSIAE